MTPRRSLAAAVAVMATVALTACEPVHYDLKHQHTAGTVVDRDRYYAKPLWHYRVYIKGPHDTQDWMHSVSRSQWKRCKVGTQYPACKTEAAK